MGPESVPTSSGRRAPGNRAHHRRAWGLGLVATALLCAGSCGFPEYDFDPQPGPTGGSGGGGGAGGTPQGGAGAAGVSGSGGDSAGGGSGGSSGSSGGGGNGGSSGSSGSGGNGGTVADCKTPRVPLPETCYDGVKVAPETDIDCGGGTCIPCSNRACLVDSDCVTNCVTGTCRVEFKIDYQAVNRVRLTQQPQFTLRLVYANGSAQLPINAFKIRYYLKRGTAFEPILIRSTNGFMHLGNTDVPFQAGQLTWQFVKVSPNPDLLDEFDAYVEIQATTGQIMVQGDYMQVYGELFGGTGGQFDQATHPSYDETAVDFIESAKIAVFQNDELVWGYVPRGGGQPSCFYGAFNINGSTLDIGGETWEGGSGAGVTSTGSGLSFQSEILMPAVSEASRASMLRSSYQITPGQEVVVPVENGTYLANVFVWSGATGAETGTLVLEGTNRETFKSDTVDNGRSWAALGPHLVTVADGTLNIGVAGAGSLLRVSGLELRTPAAP
jgi:hypothetical protein